MIGDSSGLRHPQLVLDSSYVALLRLQRNQPLRQLPEVHATAGAEVLEHGLGHVHRREHAQARERNPMGTTQGRSETQQEPDRGPGHGVALDEPEIQEKSMNHKYHVGQVVRVLLEQLDNGWDDSAGADVFWTVIEEHVPGRALGCASACACETCLETERVHKGGLPASRVLWWENEVEPAGFCLRSCLCQNLPDHEDPHALGGDGP